MVESKQAKGIYARGGVGGQGEGTLRERERKGNEKNRKKSLGGGRAQHVEPRENGTKISHSDIVSDKPCCVYNRKKRHSRYSYNSNVIIMVANV